MKGTGCGRQYCRGCGEELIHRDHRKAYESASALGQIVARSGPVNLTVTDLDLVALKGLANGRRRLFLCEQKQPTHTLRTPQGAVLRLLDDCVAHCVGCPQAADLRLDPCSGLILVRGHIAGSTRGRRETCFDGPQTITHLRLGYSQEFTSHEEFFRMLDPEDSQRRRRVGWKGAA